MKEWSRFETDIQKINSMYLRRGIGVVEKIPNGNKTIRKNGMAQMVRDGQTGCDFIGHLRGVPVAFDCKSTKNKTRFPLGDKRVVLFKPHQLDFLKAFDDSGGFGFLLMKMSQQADIFLVPINDFLSMREDLHARDKKSIPIAMLEKYRVALYGIYVDYEKKISELIGERDG